MKNTKNTNIGKYYILSLDQLPNMASHCPQEDCDPPVMYKGVIVQWDEDHDERVLGVLDKMTGELRGQLLAVQEHEGAIAFIWRDRVPLGYGENGSGIVAPDGDWWCVVSSHAVKPVIITP